MGYLSIGEMLFVHMVAEIAARGLPQHPSEHVGKGRHALITKIKRYGGNGLAGAQPGEGGEKAGLLPPRRQPEPGLLAENAGERPSAHPRGGGPVVDIGMRRGRGHEVAAQVCKLGMGRERLQKIFF